MFLHNELCLAVMGFDHAFRSNVTMSVFQQFASKYGYILCRA